MLIDSELQVMRICTMHNDENVTGVIHSWSLAGQEVVVEKKCVEHQSECRSVLYGVNVK